MVGLAVLDFIERGFSRAPHLMYVERVVVVDDRNQERSSRAALRARINNRIWSFCCVAGSEMVHLLGGLGLRCADLLDRLRAERFEFLLVGFGLASAHIAAQSRTRREARAFFRLHENLEVRLDVRLIADFGQQERIHVPARGDEVQIAPDAGLGRVNVAEVVRTVDDPEFLVACSEIEDLFVSRAER